MQSSAHILVTHEPRVYRESLATVLAALRPRFQVHLLDPVAVDEAFVPSS